MSFYKITQFSCDIPAGEVLSHMGMPQGASGGENEMLLETEQELLKYKSKFLEYVEPLALLASGKIEPAGREIPVAACVTTLGKKMEQWISQLYEGGEVFAAMVMDAASDVYLFHMQKELSLGLSLLCSELHAGIEGRILIPEELPIKVQEQIAVMTHAEEHGITLNEAYMFSPLKTLSILFRLGKEGSFCIGHDCSRCAKKGCPGKHKLYGKDGKEKTGCRKRE